MTLNQPFACTNTFYIPFVRHTISLWNSLTAEQAAVTTLVSSF